jgi:RNA polymerase sigma-70 factor (ECF subfamily)
MISDPSFADLMARLRAGDEDAAARVFERFARRLIALARRRLDQLLRQKIDPEDILQSVFKSFFRRHADGRLDLKDWDSLWTMLAVITVRKCGHKIEQLHTQRRDVRKERSTSGEASASAWEALARDPTPLEAAVLSETVERLMHGLEERDRQILQLRLQEYTIPEISARVGRTQYTVGLVLRRAKQRLQHLRDAESNEP